MHNVFTEKQLRSYCIDVLAETPELPIISKEAGKPIVIELFGIGIVDESIDVLSYKYPNKDLTKRVFQFLAKNKVICIGALTEKRNTMCCYRTANNKNLADIVDWNDFHYDKRFVIFLREYGALAGFCGGALIAAIMTTLLSWLKNGGLKWLGETLQHLWN